MLDFWLVCVRVCLAVVIRFNNGLMFRLFYEARLISLQYGIVAELDHDPSVVVYPCFADSPY